MTARTAMASALMKAGMNPADYAFGAAVQAYKRAGGSAERGLEIFRDIFGLPGEGQVLHAAGQTVSALPRQAVEDAAGRRLIAATADEMMPAPSSSNRGGEGHARVVDATVHQNLPALPVRDASTTRGLTSITS